MATIKLKSGKVLTTNGRPRCLCCDASPPEDECCPYPADKLNVLYRREDLPESLTIGQTAFEYEVIMELALSGPDIYQGTLNSEPVTLNIVSNRWELNSQDWAGQVCLFWDYSLGASSWPFIPPDQSGSGGFTYPVDGFKDTYIATSNSGPTLTMVRESLCIWRSRNANGNVDNTLYYRTNASEQDVANSGIGRVLWAFNGVYRSDAGPYNSPEGVYGNTWTVV